jgi:streptomycin 6-kinase
MTLPIPPGLMTSCGLLPERVQWLDALPMLVAELAERWSLSVEEVFVHAGGTAAWVARVRRADGSHAVLKVGLPHFEAEHEIAGLRFWNGDPTVDVLAADEAANAMLLEACEPGTPLSMLDADGQDTVIASVLTSAWRSRGAAGNAETNVRATFRPLRAMLAHWEQETRLSRSHWVDSGLVEAGLTLFHELSAPGAEDVLLFTDLHADNVLRSARAPWLAIDPKPFVGDAAYDATQHLFNSPDRLLSHAEATVERVAGLLGLSAARVKLWTFARAAAEPRADWDGSWRNAVARTLARRMP